MGLAELLSLTEDRNFFCDQSLEIHEDLHLKAEL